MPMPDTEIRLGPFLDAIVAAVRAGVPALQHVAVFEPDRKDPVTPGCYIELVSLEPDDGDPGTGQLALVAVVSANVVVNFRAPRAKVVAPQMAVDVATFAKGQRWGLPVEPALIVDIAPNDFHSELDQFEVWAVEWRQIIHAGRSVWDNDGVLPGEVFGAVAPDIGPDHEAEYSPINGGMP